MKEKFDHILSMASVRKMCIQNDYYTWGTNEEYENMFNMFYGKDVTPSLLRKVAKDIKEHSETEDTEFDILMSLTRLVAVNIEYVQERV